jgi:Domain of unknown function (DUF4160)
MSPTIFIHGPNRFYFFSREEKRVHVHVQNPKGEAKIWIEPQIELAQNYGLNSRQINAVLHLVEEHEDEIRKAWKKHFGG